MEAKIFLAYVEVVARGMKISITNLKKTEIEIKVELAPEEVQGDLEAAAKRLSESSKIPGFRPGHAPYETVKGRLGEMKIWEEAMETIIRRTYFEAVSENKIATIGQPYFSVETLAPGNPIVYKVTTAILPKITKLADYRSVSVQKKEAKIEEKDVETALKQVARMQIKEKEVEREAGREDKVAVDMSMYLDNVPLEGGTAKGHGIYLAEEYYVPGLNEKLLGIKKGENREFNLEFPKEHFQKNIAGKKINFKVIAKAVYELIHPPMDDSFAKSLGQENMQELRALIRKNMESEAEFKKAQREEIEILEKIVDGSSFEDIPDILLNTEIERMVKELEHSVAEQGLEFNKYLDSIKKTVPQLKLDLSPQALRRIKTALTIREIAEREGIEPDEKEVTDEITKAVNQYSSDPDAQKVIRSEEYLKEARGISKNKKTIEFLRKTLIK